jgi:hypothetical protein
MSDDLNKRQAELLKQIPPAELKIRRELGQAMMRFTMWIMSVPPKETLEPGERDPRVDFDHALRRHQTEKYRLEVEKAAAQGVENILCWHTLATWTEDGKERIGYFARIVELVESGHDAHLQVPGPHKEWTDTHMRADCLYEIGRVHAHEGDPAVARGFLERALPLAQEAERLRAPAGITHDDRLEGKIAELLVQLPDEPA